MTGYCDVTGFGDKERQTTEIGAVITDPEVIARMDAERDERSRLWHERAEAEALAEGYDSLDQKLDIEYWHGPLVRKRDV